MKLVNLYSPNDKALSRNALTAVEDHYRVVGDFNSHSQSWVYDHIDKRGEEVEDWQDDHRLNLINKPEDQTAVLVSSSSIPVVQHRLPVLPQESTVPTIEQKQRHLSRQHS